MNISLSLAAVVMLLAANGFFVAAEFALVKARGFRIETLANEGSPAARLTLRIQANLEAYLAACQLGITMASLGLGWVGEPAVAALLEPLFERLGVPDALLHTSAFVVGFLIFSSLHIVIGEQVPKTLAIRQAEPVSLWTAYPLHFVYRAVWPLNWLLNQATRTVLAACNVAEATHADVYSGEEIRGIVTTSHEHGEIHNEQASMLHNLFEFDHRQVGRVMIPRNHSVCLDVSAPAEGNLAAIRDAPHSRFPVVDSAKGDTIVGILLAKDIFSAMLAEKTEPWRNLQAYIRDPLLVPESQRVSQLFERMRLHRAHMAFVLNEYGDFIGIVTLEDLLEESVGEIEDETDRSTPMHSLFLVGEERWEADGLVSLADVERQTGLRVDVELDANTLSGLFLERLARMPEVGDELREQDFLLKVLSIKDHTVGRVAIARQGLSSHAGAERMPEASPGDG